MSSNCLLECSRGVADRTLMLEPIAVRRVAHPPIMTLWTPTPKIAGFAIPPHAEPAIAISGILVPYYLLLCPLPVPSLADGVT